MSIDTFGLTFASHYRTASNPPIPRLQCFYTVDGAIDFDCQKNIHFDAPTNPTDNLNKSWVELKPFRSHVMKKLIPYAVNSRIPATE